ncbi:MAG: hypothetical protein ACREUG_18590, partial [Steroidobacteraceae bacterium]
FVRDTGGGALGNSRELQSTVFSDPVLNEHRLGGPVLVSNDRLVLVKSLEHHLPAPKPLAQVRDTIVAAIRNARENAAALAAAQGAVKQLEGGAAGSGTAAARAPAFDGIASSLGVAAEPSRFIARSDPSVPAQIRDEVFSSPKPRDGQPVFRALALESGGAVIIGVTAVKTGTGETDPRELASTRRQQAGRYGADAADDYLEQLRLTAKVEKNLQVFQQ